MLTYKVGFVGAGAMSEAIASGLVRKKLFQRNEMVFSSRNKEKLKSFVNRFQTVAASSNDEVIQTAEIIIIAVKPQQFPVVCQQLTVAPGAGQVIVSIMAGISIATLEQHFPSVPIFRAMPNTPAKIGYGMTGLTMNKLATESQKRVVEQIFESVGQVVNIEEQYMDALGAVSGSGPAYMYEAMEALADGGVLVGLPRELAYQLVAQTMVGAAQMVLLTKEHPAVLKDQVTSPGGTTIRALEVLEQNGVRGAYIEAVEQACLYSRELGEKK